MSVLNLTSLEKSDIKYKVSKFPDGQQQINILGIETEEVFNKPEPSFGRYMEKIIKPINKSFEITIKSRLNNFLDLELIICSVASLRSLGIKEIHLYVPFFLGSRSDRKFEKGSNNYLKDVICPIINSLNFESVTCIDSHSDVLEACLNNFQKVSNLELVNHSLNQICGPNLKNICLISPDAGANKKIYHLAEQIGYTGDIITCSKSRGVDGKLSKTKVPTANYDGKDLIIIDDICDGGRTFINIAEEFKKILGFNSEIYLIITHGIFSSGFKELFKHFDGIYCTNSYSVVPEFEWDGDKRDVKTIVRQLNVF